MSQDPDPVTHHISPVAFAGGYKEIIALQAIPGVYQEVLCKTLTTKRRSVLRFTLSFSRGGCFRENALKRPLPLKTWNAKSGTSRSGVHAEARYMLPGSTGLR